MLHYTVINSDMSTHFHNQLLFLNEQKWDASKYFWQIYCRKNLIIIVFLVVALYLYILNLCVTV